MYYILFDPQGAHPSYGQPTALPRHEMDDHGVQGQQTQTHTHVWKTFPGTVGSVNQGGQRHQEEARAAQDGRSQQSVRSLPLVVERNRSRLKRSQCRCSFRLTDWTDVLATEGQFSNMFPLFFFFVNKWMPRKYGGERTTMEKVLEDNGEMWKGNMDFFVLYGNPFPPMWWIWFFWSH